MADPLVIFPDLVASRLPPEDTMSRTLSFDATAQCWTLRIPGDVSIGYDVALHCYSYGLYHEAGDWHGSPWDFAPDNTRAMCEHAIDFTLRLLSGEARLRIFKRGDKPHRWLIELRNEKGEWHGYEECGLLVYNYFGRREVVVRQNKPRSDFSPREDYA